MASRVDEVITGKLFRPSFFLRGCTRKRTFRQTDNMCNMNMRVAAFHCDSYRQRFRSTFSVFREFVTLKYRFLGAHPHTDGGPCGGLGSSSPSLTVEGSKN
jgi:hypothetical protein